MSLATRGFFRGCFSGTTTAVLRDPSPRALSVWRRVVKFLILWVDLFSKVVCVSQDLANQVRFCTEFQRCMKEGTAPRDAKYLRPPTAEYMSGEGFNAVFDLDSVLNKLASVRPTSWMDKCSSKLCQQGSVFKRCFRTLSASPSIAQFAADIFAIIYHYDEFFLSQKSGNDGVSWL